MLFLLLVGLAFFLAMPVQVNLNSTLEAYWGRAGSGSTERPKISKEADLSESRTRENTVLNVQSSGSEGEDPCPQPAAVVDNNMQLIVWGNQHKQQDKSEEDGPSCSPEIVKEEDDSSPSTSPRPPRDDQKTKQNKKTKKMKKKEKKRDAKKAAATTIM